MARLPDTSESLLVRLASPDDVAAWEEFVRLYAGAVANYCRARGLQDADVDEIVQEVLLLVHRKIPDWKPSGGKNSFRVWLLRTAHRLCLAAIRKQSRFDRAVGGTSVQQTVQALPDCHGEKTFDDESDWQRWAFQWAAWQIQQEVQSSTWQSFWLTAVQDLPPEEVAKTLGIHVGTVYTNKCRVLSKIRNRVAELSRIEE
ncbi:MAG: sigma-70 family RNA polymerase sigma factor [Pirellulaceae bacterium]